MIKGVFFKNSAGSTISALHHVPEKESIKGIIFCHGMQSDKNGTKAKFLAEHFEKAGFHFLRFDFRYCGKSEGKFENITISGEVEDLRAAYEYFIRSGITEISLIGSSLGGTVAMIFASKTPEIKKLVTISAPYFFEKLIQKWFPGEMFTRFKKDGYAMLPDKAKINWTFVDDTQVYDFDEIIKNVKSPVFFIHGNCDLVVDWENTRYAYGIVTAPKKILIIEGGDHPLNSHIDVFYPMLSSFLS